MSHQVLQSFEVLSAEFMHSDIADEESRARSPRWDQFFEQAKDRPTMTGDGLYHPFAVIFWMAYICIFS